MIAQGEFRRLLSADTKARADILRKLFGTEYLATFKEILRSRANALKHDYQDSLRTTTLLADQAYFDEESDEAFNIATLKTDERLTASVLKEALTIQLERDHKKAQAYQGALEKLTSTKDYLSRTLDGVKRQEELTHELNDLEENLTQSLQSMRAVETKLTELEQQKSARNQKPLNSKKDILHLVMRPHKHSPLTKQANKRHSINKPKRKKHCAHLKISKSW